MPIKLPISPRRSLLMNRKLFTRVFSLLRLVWLVSSVSSPHDQRTTVIKVSGSCCCYCVMYNFKGNSRHVDLMIRLGVSLTIHKLKRKMYTKKIDAVARFIFLLFYIFICSANWNFIRENLITWRINWILPSVDLLHAYLYRVVFKSSLLIKKRRANMWV